MTNPAPGPVTIEVDDKSDEHNFHLTGPGVDVSTMVEEIAKKSFQVTLADGVYDFICDAHPTRMVGRFTAGTGGSGGGSGGGGTGGGGTGGTGGTTTKPPSAPVGSTLLLTSGPGYTITLKTKAGKRVTRLKPGGYKITVRDRSSSHNAHLLGAGVNRKTSVLGTGTQTWKVVPQEGHVGVPVRSAQDRHARQGHRRRRVAACCEIRGLADREAGPTAKRAPWVLARLVSAGADTRLAQLLQHLARSVGLPTAKRAPLGCWRAWCPRERIPGLRS